MRTRHSARRCPVSLNTLALLFAFTFQTVATVHAAPFTWDGGGTNSNWKTGDNWSSNVAPTNDGSSTLIFSGNTRTSPINNFDADTIFAAITFANDFSTGKTAAFSLSGNRITLGGDVTATLPTIDGTITDQISLPILLSGGTRTFTANLSLSKIHNLTISGIVGGSQGLTKAGQGTLTLSGPNTYSGKTTVSAGKLYFNSIDNVGAANSALGAPMTPADGTIDLGGGGTLYYTGGAATSDRAITLTSGGGTVYAEGSGRLTLTGGVTGSNVGFTFRGSSDITETGVITLGSGALTHTGYGILTLSCPTNSFSGAVSIYAGTVSVETISDAGTPSALGQGSLIELGQANFANIGTLRFTGAGGGTCNRAIKVQATGGSGAGGIIENTVAGQTLTLGGNVSVAGTATNLLLQLTGAGNGVMSGVIGGTLSIAKSGAGTWALSGANTYTGTTAVTAGTLLVNGSTAAGCAINVGAAGTLGGTGTVNGVVGVAAGGKISPGNGGIGTLALAGNGAALTLNGGMLDCEISNAAGICDSIALSGPLVLNGVNTIGLSFPNGTPPAGSYTLMTYPSRSGTGSLTLAPALPNYKLVVENTRVTFIVSGSSVVWKGDGSANMWDTTTENWVSGTYADNDVVIFDDAGSDAPAIDIASGTVEPFSVTVTNNVKAYDIGGAGGIGGTGGLVKSGTNTLTLSCTNTYRGATVVNCGTLTLNGSLSNSSINVASGATFTENAGGTIAGEGVNFTSYGTATLSGSNTYGGVTTVGLTGISNVFVTVNNNKALGSTAEGTTVNGGHTSFSFENKLILGKNITVTGETLTLASEAGCRASLHYAQYSGFGTWDGNIALPSTSSDTYLWSDFVGGTLMVGTSSDDTITGTNGTLTVRGGGAIVINSRISIGSMSITRNDAGTCTLNSTNNVWNNTGIAQGTLILGVPDALPSTTRLSIGKSYPGNNAIFDLNGKHQHVAGLAETYAAGTTTQRIISAAPATLIVSNDTANTFGASGSSIEGAVTLVKAGTNTLTLTGTNTTSGAFIVSNGTLTVSATGTFGANSTNITVAAGTLTLQNSNAIADSAALRIANGGGAKVNLEAGVNESVGTLYFGDKQKRASTYGATDSGAAVIDDAHFSGKGILTVRHGNGGTLIRLH